VYTGGRGGAGSPVLRRLTDGSEDSVERYFGVEGDGPFRWFSWADLRKQPPVEAVAYSRDRVSHVVAVARRLGERAGLERIRFLDRGSTPTSAALSPLSFIVTSRDGRVTGWGSGSASAAATRCGSMPASLAICRSSSSVRPLDRPPRSAWSSAAFREDERGLAVGDDPVRVRGHRRSVRARYAMDAS